MIPSRREAGPSVPVLVPRVGTSDLSPWSPTPPRSGWTVESASAAAWTYSHQEVSIPRRGVATAAWLVLANSVDKAAGLHPAHPRSLRRQEIEERLDGVDRSVR